MGVIKFCMVIFVFTFLQACVTNDDINIVTLSINPEEAKQAKLNEKFDQIEIVRLESNDSIIIGTVNNLMFGNNLVYILDINTKSVFIFDKTGKIISTIQDSGQGPDEYYSLSGFYLNEKSELVLIDNSRKKENVYTSTGKYIKSNKIPFSVKSVDYLNDGTKIIVRDVVDSSNPNGHIVYVSTSQNVRAKFLPFTYQSGSTIFEKNQCVTTSSDEFYYSSLSSDTVWRYSCGLFVPQYVIDFQGKGIPTEIYDLGRNKFGEAFYNLIYDRRGEIAYWPFLTNISEEKVCLSYVFNNNMCYCSYDLATETATQFSGPMLGCINLSEISTGQFYANGVFCFVLDNYKIIQLDKEKLESVSTVYPSIYATFVKTKIDDNPILLLAKLKP